MSSFQEKMSALMARPGQDPVSKDEVSWWLKFAGRGVGTLGGFIAIFLGIWNCVSILLANVAALIAGLWQIVAGFIVLCIEAPCCCMFIDHVQRISDVVEHRPFWNRAVAYVIMAIPPIIIEIGTCTILGSGLIFATGVIYGMMALGKKASVEEMRQAAAASEAARPSSGVPSSNMRSNLVANAQPISFTGAPVLDSNI
ncbi:calcium channel flower isoform X1 [Euwallacea fornicatus]|uniref:calcium channel flower isoform X1 n=1 Tax=Euwallacea fornicatus TaxID=995702 RepID=UPI00338E8177